MNSTHEVTITIDNRTIAVERGLTILQAAERNNIRIPTLCAHKDLTPFGGCRMCIVEVDKMRGLPTACTTPVEEGMVIRTHTAQVHAVRQEILQLILSEHTSSCLICNEKEECKLYSPTIRKAGVTTGCRYCSNDNRCELQDVVIQLGLQEIGYPIYYRHLPVEKEDPFFDRDYNLCILCGRCIRMCQDIRTAGTLAFTQRGRQTVIGTAFHRSHIEAGCEFCGACVSVCPTGALAEKSNKWEGKPEHEEVTTCPFCGIGCQMRLQAKGDMILGSLPVEDPLINHGQLCVKGRFCIPELVNGPSRLLKPQHLANGAQSMLTWEQAIDLSAARLSACAPEDFGMLISPNCSNEDLYVAQKFVRAVMGSHHIDTTARMFYGTGFNAYLRLFKRAVPLSELEKASMIVCLGLDARYGRSVIGVELRKAIKQGAKIVTIHPRRHSLSIISQQWIQSVPGTESEILHSLVNLTGVAAASASVNAQAGELNQQIQETVRLLKEAPAPVLLVGSEFLQYDTCASILEAIDQLARNTGAGVVLLPAQSNLLGTILMGASPEVLPAGMPSSNPARICDLGMRWGVALPELQTSWNSASLGSGRKLRVLYLIGEAPARLRSCADFIIFQDMYPPDLPREADLLLPAAAFSEVDGSFINGEGRIQKIRKAVQPPGEALADWQILCRIAQKMGASGFDYQSISDIRQEISAVDPELADFNDNSRKFRPLLHQVDFASSPSAHLDAKKKNGGFPLLLSVAAVEHTYRAFPLSTWVEGAKTLFAEGIVHMNPKDAETAGISNGDDIILSSDYFERVLPARVQRDQPEGILHAVLRQGEVPNPNPLPVRIRKKDV
jgi:formate dehydrogenase alpha subunit